MNQPIFDLSKRDPALYIRKGYPKEVEARLDRTLAFLFSVRLKFQVYHWYVEGPSFYGFHKVTEKGYKILDEYIDQFAERMRTLGLRPISSFEEIVRETRGVNHIHDKFMRYEQMLDDLTYMLDEVSDEIEDLLDFVGPIDRVTEDLGIQILSSIEKLRWKVRSFK